MIPGMPRTSTRHALPAKAAPLDPHAGQVLRRFRLVFNSVKAHFRAIEKKAGIAGAQVWALSVVASSPGIGVTALAQAMDIHQTTASNLVKSLVASEMLRVAPAAEDRRSRVLHLTAGGRAVLRRVPGPFEGLLPEALSRLDRATLSRLDRDLGRLIDLLGVDTYAEQVPLGDPDR